MRLADRLCSLALRTYPRDFRDESREEVLATIADMRDGGDRPNAIRQAMSLGHNGNRLRWLRATGGSVSQTVRQGLAWGVLLLVGRQAGLGIYSLLRTLGPNWKHPTLLPNYPSPRPSSVDIALLAGWVAVFWLLATGRRRWGLPVLGVVLGGFVAHQVMYSLGYGGHFVWLFTLNFFLPALLPLLCAYVWPAQGARFSWRLMAAVLTVATVAPYLQTVLRELSWSLQMEHGLLVWWAAVAACVIAASFAVLVGLSDPRWAIAGTIVAFQPVAREALHEILANAGSPVFLAVLLIPAAALFLAIRARRRAIPTRG